MIRLALAVLIGLVGAGIVHIVSVLAVPTLSNSGTFERIGALGAEGTFHRMPTDDPFARAVACAVPLDQPRRVVATGSEATGEVGFWSASVLARGGEAIYSLNDRTAIDGTFDLILATPATITELRAELDENAPELVAVPTDRAAVVLRTHVADPSLQSRADRFLASASCGPLEMG